MWGSIRWRRSKVLRRTEWTSQGRKDYLIHTQVTFCVMLLSSHLSDFNRKNRAAGNPRSVLLLTSKINKIRRSYSIPVICYWFVFYLAILYFKQNAFNHFTDTFLNYIISLNFFMIDIYFKYILWPVITWQCAFLLVQQLRIFSETAFSH